MITKESIDKIEQIADFITACKNRENFKYSKKKGSEI